MVKLRLQSVVKTFSGVKAVDSVNLEVCSQELVVLVGPSGCGKSTLLRLIAGLEEPTEGRILLNEKDLTRTPPGSRNIAMVFQNYALYPLKTVFENLAFALRMRRIPGAEVDRLVRETADRLGLRDLLQRYPTNLSGGQQQRVALGRALVRKPELFLFDEPLSNLDMNLRRELRQEIKRLQRETATPGLYVTHDQEEAMSLGDRLVVMHGGRFVQIGTPQEIYSRPASRFVAGFFGSPPMNLLEGELMERGDRLHWERPHATTIVTSSLSRPFTNSSDRKLCLGFRPESVRHGRAGANALNLCVKVIAVEPLGDHNDVLAMLESGERITARFHGDPIVREGEEVELHVPEELWCWFQ